jgi:acetylornithine deacetylase/succinyl-diaminopimelate desuccinylase-like protein
MNSFLFAVTGFFLLAAAPTGHASEPAESKLAHDIMVELVAINTAPSGGDDTSAAVALLVRHLKAAGFNASEITILGQTPALQNLIVRYPSKKPARRPLLLMAHLDVVEALSEDWNYEPFAVTEEDGWYYGRGTNDNKTGAASLVANFIRLRNEGFEPDRDMIVMLTADEETTGNATKWLLAEHRDLIDAELALNTDGGPILVIDGKPLALMLQTSEKIFASFALEATDPGGHSSRPHRDSAISRLSRALVDLEAYEFPIDLNDTSRAFFERWIGIAPEDETLIRAVLSDEQQPDALDALLDEYYYNAIARTTCVATQLSGGHAENALPQTAQAVVNCRYLPQSDAQTVRTTLQELVTPYDVSVSDMDPSTPSPPSPLSASVVDPITRIAESMWDGIAVIPEMSTGASDGAFVRNAGIPTYTVSAIADDPNDMRAHGQDERISVQAFNDANEFWYRLIKSFASP